MVFILSISGGALAQSQLTACQGSNRSEWNNCIGSITYPNNDMYIGEVNGGKRNGQGTYYYYAENQFKGDKYVGDFVDGQFTFYSYYFNTNRELL